MTGAGAAGITAEEMGKVLHLAVGPAGAHEALGELLRELASSEDRALLVIANRLWGQHGYSFRADFLAICSDDYGADLGPGDSQVLVAVEGPLHRRVDGQAQRFVRPGHRGGY